MAMAIAGALASMASGAALAQADEYISGPETATYTPMAPSTQVVIEPGGSIITTTGDAMVSRYTLMLLGNQGTISADHGIGLSVDGSATASVATIDYFANEGVVRGSTAGIRNGDGSSTGTIGMLLNVGTISSANAGIDNRNPLASLDNRGNIMAGGIGIDNGGPAGAAGSPTFARASIGTILNSGIISGTDIAIRSSTSIGGIHNQAGGTINGNVGIQVEGGGIGVLRNDGYIRGADHAVLNHSTDPNAIVAILNSGTIDGTILNLGQLGNGTFGIENSGSITALDNRGQVGSAAMGVRNLASGTFGAITNSGTIGTRLGGSPSVYGMENSGAIGLLANSGRITGNVNGVVNETSGTLTSVVNSGTIDGGTNGIRNAGTLNTLSNTGTLTGSTAALSNEGTLDTLINTGTIAGNGSGSGVAIFNGAAGTIGQIVNDGGVIAGAIMHTASSELVISGGSGASVGTLTGLGGAAGVISSSASDLRFKAGNLLLDSNIGLSGGHSVHNEGATLQLNGARSIHGNYVQGAAATLKIGVTDGAVAGSTPGSGPTDEGYGRLIVSGTAQMAAGTGVSLARTASYAFAAGQRFVVIDATAAGSALNAESLKYTVTGYTGTVTGTQTTVGGRTYLVLALNPGQAVDPTPVDPTVPTVPTEPGLPGAPDTPAAPAPAPVPPAIPATQSNAYAALDGLARYTGVTDPALLNLYNAATALNLGSAAQANVAGKRLGPASQLSSTRVAAAPTYQALQVIASRTDQLRLARAEGVPASGVSTGEAAPSRAAWGQAFGGHASQDARGDIDGYRANYGGLLIGADRELDDYWTVGGAFGYTNTRIDSSGDTDGNRTRINAYGLFGYAGYTGARWYANVSAGAIAQRYDTTRQVAFPGFAGTTSGEFDGEQYVARIEAGYPLAAGAYTVTPIGGLIYSYLHQDAYTETGGNGAALAVGTAHATSVRSLLGAKLERGFQTASGLLTPFVQLQWSHEYNRSRQSLSAGFAADPSGATLFSTVGARPVADMAVLYVGATLLRGNTLNLTARYGLEAGGGFTSHTGSLQVRKLF